MGKLYAMPSRFGRLPRKVPAPPKVADRFYTSPEWQALKRTKRAEGAWCVVCGSTKRLILDHIIERKDGGADLDPSNVEWLCHLHHQQKTARAREARARGDAVGLARR